jgi:Trk K+ transport system NAD-binding subunit/Kef-type K+ transport system membrane component KefB
MTGLASSCYFLAIFTFVCFASQKTGDLFSKIKLPLITGFLAAGIATGPDVFEFIKKDHIPSLRFIDDVSLAFIAYAAGSELFLKNVKSRITAISWILIFQLIATYTICSFAIYFLSDYIPFLKEMNHLSKVGVSIIAGSILIARSPSSAIAIIKELRARGMFTQTVLGVTVIIDVLVIVFFAIAFSIAGTLISNKSFDSTFALYLVLELLLSVLAGILLEKFICYVFKKGLFRAWGRTTVIMCAGYLVFVSSKLLGVYSQEHLNHKIVLEPLLVCMIAGFMVANFSSYRADLIKALHKIEIPIYVAFFTLTGASIDLNVIKNVWQIALVLFGVRIFSIFIGAFMGGTLAKDPVKHNMVSWMSYVTQAGVGLGLAKHIASSYSGWGESFATLIIAVIIINQVLGPPLMKLSLFLVEEAHPKAKKSDADVEHSAIIFGSGGNAFTLAKQLMEHDWRVTVIRKESAEKNELINEDDFNIQTIEEIEKSTLEEIGADHCGAIVCMLSDDDNYKICEIGYEHFGMANLVVRLNNRDRFNDFKELGAYIVFPSTAIIGLLDHYVRSPSAATLLLSEEGEKDIINITMENQNYDGRLLKNMILPDDLLFMNFKRQGRLVTIHGQYRPRLGDVITVAGSNNSLDEVKRRFSL